MARYSAAKTGQGALSGAATGAAFGPIGMGIGAGIGGLAGFFGSRSTKKSRAKDKQALAGNAPGQRLSSMDARQKLFHYEQAKALHGKGKLADLYKYNKNAPGLQYDKKAANVYRYDPNNAFYRPDLTNPGYTFDAAGANANFNQNVVAPAYQNFQENLVPTISGQFRGNNLQNSTYFGNALGKAATDVQKNLDAQRANMIFQGNQTANNRLYEGYNVANERAFQGMGQQQAAQYAGLNQANNRQYKGFQDANRNRAQGLENILNRSTFGYNQAYKPQQGYLDQFLSASAPAAGEWFANYLKPKTTGDSTGIAPNTDGGTGFNWIPNLFKGS